MCLMWLLLLCSSPAFASNLLLSSFFAPYSHREKFLILPTSSLSLSLFIPLFCLYMCLNSCTNKCDQCFFVPFISFFEVQSFPYFYLYTSTTQSFFFLLRIAQQLWIFVQCVMWISGCDCKVSGMNKNHLIFSLSLFQSLHSSCALLSGIMLKFSHIRALFDWFHSGDVGTIACKWTIQFDIV